MKVNDRIGDIIETEIKDLAYDGKAVGSNNGKIVFLNAGLPGEIVKAEIVKTKAKYSVGKVSEILKKSDERVTAQCRHFDICGGCTWQDLDYKSQLYFKRKQVIDCIEHIGKLQDVQIDEIVPCQENYYYRNKMEFSFNKTAEGFALGLHRRGRWDEIFDIDKCLLESETSNEIISLFRDFVRENTVPVYDVKNHTGFLRFLMIREAKNTDQIMINIVTCDGEIPNIDNLIEAIIEKHPNVKTIVQNITNQKANVAKGEKEIVLLGNGFIEEHILEKKFRIYANSFFQTNSRQAEVLYNRAFDFLDPDKNDKLIDLYCGAGTIGICASERVLEVVGIELEPTAIQAAEENAGINNIKNINFHAGSVQDTLKEQPELFEGVTCAIVDPPRAGMHPKALKRLIELDLNKIVYVSCNPATFSRDAAKLIDKGYRLNRVVPVDMFPHTMHIELTAGFYK